MKTEIPLKAVSRITLLQEFELAPESAWFDQAIVAAVRDCSEATIERDRWAGSGVPFIKCGRTVRYRKSDILDWLAKHTSHQSTARSQQFKKMGVLHEN